MRKFYLALGSIVVLILFQFIAIGGEAVVGKAAPDFTLTDSNGKSHSLGELKGKFIVLEWVNFDCPFVRKHYDSGNMQKLQKTYTAKGVIWLSVNSSAPGRQGNFTPDKINSIIKERGAAPTAYLIDANGQVGKMYGARNTPHMFVINPEGRLIYNGAIDDRPSTDLADISGAKNYLAGALDEAMANRPVTVSATQPYGCSVKY